MFPRLLSVAPMMKVTDKHFRYLVRLMSKRIGLYTEMITTDALLHGRSERFLSLDAIEHPVALQLGGSDPKALAKCAKLGVISGYSEINLNVGCPSSRVQAGAMGACLMLEPQRVAEMLAAMREAVSCPVTVKTRIGVDHYDTYQHLARFIDVVSQVGTHDFIVHARKAWLKGLNPRQNRQVPPLQYDTVYRLKQDFPHLTIVINGGITTHPEIHHHLKHLDGVMLGRVVADNPYFLSTIDRDYFDEKTDICSRETVLGHYVPYVLEQRKLGVGILPLIRPLTGLFRGLPGASTWRGKLSNLYPLRKMSEFEKTLIQLIDFCPENFLS